ncbi:unnamed protein product [Trifolium pratense]|uniref:Uncharacterized protein n=1 Tax=Trifolium pratense TaxID=57577 RepID=A0ACB0KGW8_TRIPR|nr:unnamed protein product [Trifolium pratense]
MVEAAEDDFYLPDECWEHAFKFFIIDKDNNNDNNYYNQFYRYLKLESLSLVSRQFLSITNRLRLSIRINGRTLPFLPRLFQRFTNLTSLELRNYCGDIHKYLDQLSGFSLNYESTIPANGLQAISQNISNLTSLKCYSVDFLNNNTNMFHIAHCFPNLQMLDLSCCFNVPAEGIGHVLNTCCNIRHLNLKLCCGVKLHGMNFKAPKLEVLNLSYTIVDDETLYMISKSCRQLLQLYLRHCYCVTEKVVKHVVENCTQLREIDLRACTGVHAHVVESMVSSRPSLRKIV